MDEQASELSRVPDDTPRNMLQHPDGWKCRTCKKWIGRDRYKVAVTPDGKAARVVDLIKAGIPIPGTATVTEISTCTDQPVWQQMPGDHWCWQYVANLEQ